jgi:hypothetical protein
VPGKFVQGAALNALTKLFVVLLAVTSMLSTTGFIVFVGKQKPLQPSLDEMSNQLKAAILDRDAARIEAQKAKDEAQNALAIGLADAKAVQAVNAQLQAKNSDDEIRISQLNADKAARDATINTMQQNLAWAQSSVSKLEDIVATLRTNNDKLTKQTEDDSRTIADKTNLSETLQTRLNDATEKNAALLVQNDKYRRALTDHGISIVDVDNAPGPNGAGQPPIAGVISAKSVINGNTYVTLSVGQSDGVTKGMTFIVFDRDKSLYLGTVTIDQVDSNDAIGRLQGDDPSKVSQVRVGNDVKTQLRGS